MERKAKIIATIGPSSKEEAIIEELINAGMDIARLNFSHGTQEEHAARIRSLRAVSTRLGRPLAILQDLQGPKIRVGALEQPMILKNGDTVTLFDQKDGNPKANGSGIPVDFPELFTSVKAGDRILLDDGRIVLSVIKTARRSLTARVQTSGELTAHKGINLPGIRLAVPSISEKDQSDLAFGLSIGVDAVAVSFVRTAQDLMRVRSAMDGLQPPFTPLLIAKLERPEALENLNEIMAAVDGVMVARGDLGVEMPPEEVPAAQKRIIREANRNGKLVITATQMLDSMIHNLLPTRAEASDVANAIFDGTDAVMLSGETAAGEYPLESLAMMDKIVRRAELDFPNWGLVQDMESTERDDAVSLASAARELAHDRDVAAIAVFTRTGRTAAIMAKARPCVPVLAFTPEETTYRRMAMYWGVIPQRIPFAGTVEKMIARVEAALKASGMVRPGQQVVVIAGFPVGEMRPPNMALLHTVR